MFKSFSRLDKTDLTETLFLKKFFFNIFELGPEFKFNMVQSHSHKAKGMVRPSLDPLTPRMYFDEHSGGSPSIFCAKQHLNPYTIYHFQHPAQILEYSSLQLALIYKKATSIIKPVFLGTKLLPMVTGKKFPICTDAMF